jgi:hypothetical protein
MLPAWATVVIALISAAGGVAGGIVTTWLRVGADLTEGRRQRAHERDERLRERQMVAADEFATGLMQAINATRELAMLLKDDAEAIERLGARTGRVSNAGAESGRMIEVAHLRFPRVRLLYPSNSVAALDAEGAIEDLRNAYAKLEERPADLDGAEKAIVSAEGRLRRFSDAIQSVITFIRSE